MNSAIIFLPFHLHLHRFLVLDMLLRIFLRIVVADGNYREFYPPLLLTKILCGCLLACSYIFLLKLPHIFKFELHIPVAFSLGLQYFLSSSKLLLEKIPFLRLLPLPQH